MSNDRRVLAAQVHFSKFIWAFALFAVLPNLVFWGIGYRFDLERAVFNLDYLFVGLLFAVGLPILGVVLFVLLFLVDVLVLVGQVYPFLRMQDLIYLAGLFSEASGAFQLLGALFLFSLIGLVFVVVIKRNRAALLPVLMLLNSGLICYGLNVYADNKVSARMWRQQSGVIVNSQSINFLEGRMGGFIESFSMSGEPFVNTGYRGRTAVWEKTAAVELNPKLLLIVAESWGSFQSESVQHQIIAPVLAKADKLLWFEQGEMDFAGGTVTAEFRELCGLRPNYFNLKSVETGFDSCLPRKLRDNGYATVAVHGAVGLMYDRIYWYPRAGFDELHFRETDKWASRCYSFPGVCDREIAHSLISSSFVGDGKKFVYWMTLNSHSMYDRRDLHGNFFNCSKNDIPSDSDVCRMTELHAQFFHDFAEVLDDESMQGVEVIVVGDHTPPLIGAGGKNNYVKPDKVSWLHFRIREHSAGL